VILARCFILIAVSSIQAFAADTARVASQNPSPMQETTRLHERIAKREIAGITVKISGVLTKEIEIFLARKSLRAKEFDLLVHFLGADYIVEHAIKAYSGNLIGAVVNLGAGSKVFNDAFEDTARFMELVDSIKVAVHRVAGHPVRLRKLILSGFSAGYGAIRRILSTQANYDAVDEVLLLDGIHASYIPERTVLAEGGTIDSTHLALFLRLAKDAARKSSRKRFLITHSEIFPGTFVSTTEATDYLLQKLQLRRKAVLRWGPLGMQQLSEAKSGHFAVKGFAGNSAPDHIDHLHALSYFLNSLSKL